MSLAPLAKKKALHKKDTCIGLVSGLNDSHWLTQLNSEFVSGSAERVKKGGG